MQIVVETSLLPHHGKCTVEKKFEGLSCKLVHLCNCLSSQKGGFDL